MKVSVLAWLLVAAAATVSVLAGEVGRAEEAGTAQQPVSAVVAGGDEREMAEARLGDFRVAVTATREPDEDAIPTASVRLTVEEQVDGAWVHVDRELVGERGGWFWYPLTGRGAVCLLTVGDTPARRTELSLLLSPSLGCSPTYRFELRAGQLVAV
ncbi:hypothetical protein GCM10009609_44810 [Pseudonocardia aurantiaca]|uniref:Uncharacterized protein n=1 Tax=Pseudonocardia aurantiaca TaxID=75290 RepID=A0ABW4FG02_9PSEU